jgi:DNA-binding LytR/AlgR family response regulator
MPTAVIADDEPHLVDYLRTRLADAWPELQIVAVAANGPDAAAAITRHRPDVAFLDIRMPGATGLEVAQTLQHDHGCPARVVFVTAYDQYALDAFDADAFDYLLKPVTDERLAQTVARLRRALDAGTPAPDVTALLAELSRRLGAQSGKRLRWIRASRRGVDGELTEQIAVDDVLYFQADDKYTCVIARDGVASREWLIRVALSELAAQLDPDEFQQIHRSVIVNMNAVSGTRRDLAGKLYVRIRGHTRELPVARQYVNVFRQM